MGKITDDLREQLERNSIEAEKGKTEPRMTENLRLITNLSIHIGLIVKALDKIEEKLTDLENRIK